MSHSPVTWYSNPPARHWRTSPAPTALGFHQTLPGYAATRLVELPEIATELGVGRVFVKDESSRLGLPAFKMLGATFAIASTLSGLLGEHDRVLNLDELRKRLANTASTSGGAAGLVLFAATDGNHGRAVAHVASLLGIGAHVFFPSTLSPAAKQAIVDEGAETTELDLPYDEVVDAASMASSENRGLLIQDTAWPGYETVPQRIVDGYSTLFNEADAQLAELGASRADLVAIPVGVGSLLQAAVQHYRSGNPDAEPAAPSVLAVQAAAAPAVIESLNAGEPRSVITQPTIMSGLNCGTVSGIAWPILHSGVDAAITVTDEQAAEAVRDLEKLDVDAGPCGAATLAGVRAALGAPDRRAELGVSDSSVVLLVSTEGRSANPVPS